MKKLNIRITKKWIKKQLLGFLIILMALLLIVLYFAPQMFITVYPGEVGVLFRRLTDGTELKDEFDEGIVVIWPWDILYKYDIRLQEHSKTIEVLTKDGLLVETEVSLRFSPNIHTIGVLHKFIGPNYAETVVIPEVEARTRNIISSFDLEELYSTDRALIQRMISDSTLKGINDQVILDTILLKDGKAESYVIFEDLFIKNIRLPEVVANQIEKKIVAEQKYLTYEYTLKEEKQEALRKAIEAAGIDSFQIRSGIPILKWKGLEVTQKLAESPNSKLIIMGTDGDLPILLNGEVPDAKTEVE